MTEHSQHGVVVVGSANVDLAVRTAALPQGGETVPGGPLEISLGGKSANQAAAAALLGADVRLVARVGADAHGDLVRAGLAAAGVDLAGLEAVPGEATGTAIITVDDHAENTIVVSAGANALVTADVVDGAAAAIASARVLGLAFEVPPPAVLRAARIAHDAGVLVVLNPSPFAVPAPELLADVDVLVVNEHELARLAPGGDVPGAMADLGELGVPAVVVTLGSRGAALLTRNDGRWDVTHVAAPTVTAVDTTGCGDAFTGALMAALAAGAPLRDAVEQGCLAGAYAATGRGAQSSYATAAQLAAFPPVGV